ncbi:MAG: hypothetical protein U1E30_00805 [Rhodoblastus sp.]
MDDFTFAMIRFDVDQEDETVEKAFERHYMLAANPTAAGKSRPVLTDTDIAEGLKRRAQLLAESGGQDGDGDGEGAEIETVDIDNAEVEGNDPIIGKTKS